MKAPPMSWTGDSDDWSHILPHPLGGGVPRMFQGCSRMFQVAITGDTVKHFDFLLFFCLSVVDLWITLEAPVMLYHPQRHREGATGGEVVGHSSMEKPVCFLAPSPSLVVISLLNGEIPGTRKCGWVTHGDGRLHWGLGGVSPPQVLCKPNTALTNLTGLRNDHLWLFTAYSLFHDLWSF